MAKWVGDFFNTGIYHTTIHNKKIPFLDEKSPDQLNRLGSAYNNNNNNNNITHVYALLICICVYIHVHLYVYGTAYAFSLILAICYMSNLYTLGAIIFPMDIFLWAWSLVI